MANVEGQVKEEALQIIKQYQNNLPLLVVFDLDCTLWPFYCDCYNQRDTPYLYPQARGILDAFKDCGIDMAIASRSHTRDIATTFLDKLGIRSMFVAEEIFASRTHKTDHFQRIQRKTGAPYESMLFFDDEDRNIDSISKLGVTSVLVDNGVNLDALREGLSGFSQQSNRNEGPSDLDFDVQEIECFLTRNPKGTRKLLIRGKDSNKIPPEEMNWKKDDLVEGD